MTTGRIKENSIKGLMYFTLFTVMISKSCTVNAQSSRAAIDEKIAVRVRAWEDSTRKIRTRNFPVYWGGGVLFAYSQSTLKSGLSKLNNMPLNFLGTNVEAVVGTPIGKIKASGGMLYSGASVPYTIDMYQGGLSGNVYLLRLSKVTYHTFEPYATVGVIYQRAQVYGYNLVPDENANQTVSYSSGEAPLAGEFSLTRLNLGAGVEYQLENDKNHFIHLFTEVTFGVPVSASASNRAFEGTKAVNLMNISVGASFGIFK